MLARFKAFCQALVLHRLTGLLIIELLAVYDRLISILKILRSAGCFTNDDDYYNNLRRYFKAINRVLSNLLLTPLRSLNTSTFSDVIDRIEEGINYSDLYLAMVSNLAPRLEEKIRQPLLSRLQQQRNKISAY